MVRLIALTLSLSLLLGCLESSELTPVEAGQELVVVTRNTPTTYFFDGDRASGFDYSLVKRFAQQHGMTLRIKVAFSLPELFDMLERGEAHIAAAGLSKSLERDTRFHASLPYLHQQPLVVQSQMPDLSWREIHAADSLELMQLVTDGKAELAIVDSIEFSIQQRLFPRIVAALELGEFAPVVWYLPRTPAGAETQLLVDDFIEAAHASGDIAQLERLHFGRFMHASRLGSLVFQRKVRDALPAWQPLIETVAEEYQMDWTLLAAIAYQESHWDPEARSRTGVRGMMMLTQATANELGIADRTDAAESLRGGARFLKDLQRRLPSDIDEPDRTSMALAAYTIGMGHLEDARVITERAGGNPHLWPDVRAHLPELQNPSVFTSTKYGFAEGAQAVTYVDNIRHYEGILQLQSLPDQRLSPPIEVKALLPEHLRDVSLPIL
ncbi:MAG: membrane-bound lytic murein transglycosylase MltF [Gammaproteobacteria bacterium]|nr:membrane-bound lytic murein transglycosylase MltF [Gammaproteobacteria bacterium]